MTARVALPSRGRLREGVADLLSQAGLSGGGGARSVELGIEFIEMRPRDAGAWLATGRLDGAFLSTDIVLEENLGELSASPLGLARSTLVAAVRDDDARIAPAELNGATVATHLPRATAAWLDGLGVTAQVVTMGGALEGVCAAGLADAIVDLRETGASLAENRLRVLAEIASCEALFVRNDNGALEDLILRLSAVVEARSQRYVMLHLPPERVSQLATILHGLAAPTVLPLAERDDLVAVHLVLSASEFWGGLGRLRDLGASGIVALPPEALLR